MRVLKAMRLAFMCLGGMVMAQGCNTPRTADGAVTLDGLKGYSILIPERATAQERYSAATLAEYLERIYRVKLPVVQETSPVVGKVISVGATARAAAAGIAPDPREQAYKLAVAGGDLYILGGTRGPVYGALALLEEDLGCRWYAKDAAPVVPARPTGTLTVVPRSYSPPFEVREPLYSDAFDSQWAAFNRLQPISYYIKVPPERGGGLANPNYFVHTYDRLIPADKYFASHPEYFPLRGGKRVASKQTDGQLCYSNPEVAGVMAATLEEEIAKTPGTRIYSVSENDNTCDNCECGACQNIIKADGVPGAQLYLANAVAAKLAVKHPDIKITTLAYVGSQKPPKHIKPGPNTVILYAPIRQRYNRISMLAPIGELPEVKAELEGWHKIAANIYLWDYVDCIGGAPEPFPNFDAVEGGWKFLSDNGVNGVFLQACFLGRGSLGELKSWLYAQKLWNPRWPQDELIAEFVASYYGPAAAELAAYVALQRQAWANYHKSHRLGEGLRFSSAEKARMRELLALALERCGDQAAYRARVERELLTLLCLSLNANPRPDTAAGYAADLKRAEELISKLGIKGFGEGVTVEGALRSWHDKLKRLGSGNGLPSYSQNSVTVKEPSCPVAKYLPDADAALGHATRQAGGNGEWGVQWSFEGFLDLLKPGTTYVMRMRVRPEFKTAPRQAGPLFHFNAYLSGTAPVKDTPLAGNFTANDNGLYRWVELGKLQVVTPGALGYLYCVPGALSKDEAVWYDYLEFVPLDEFKDAALAAKLPTITI